MNDFIKIMEEQKRLLYESLCIPGELLSPESSQTFAESTLDMDKMIKSIREAELLLRKAPPVIIIHSDPSLTELETTQIKFCRSKKKRIRKKWAKNQKNFRTMYVPCKIVFRKENGDLIAHPEMIKSIEWGLKNDPGYFIKIVDVPDYSFSKIPKFEFEPRKPIFDYGFQPLLRSPVKPITTAV